jgi:hypothetical protein
MLEWDEKHMEALSVNGNGRETDIEKSRKD